MCVENDIAAHVAFSYKGNNKLANGAGFSGGRGGEGRGDTII
jgi:hypothetical protein